MNKYLKIFTLACFFVCITATAAVAAETIAAEGSQPTIDLPSSAKIETKDDYSAGIFSQLLGPAWVAIAGENAVFGGIGKYSGLLLSIMEVINAAAMGAAAVIVFYNMALMKVATAYEGKVGGSTHSSLWTPVRTAFGFAMCVPVLKGLSLMQVFVISCISFGINAGNLIWTTAASYTTEHVASSQLDTQSSIVDTEALDSILPIFQGVLLQEVYKKTAESANEKPQWANVKEFQDFTPNSLWRSVEVRGDYVVEHRPLEGEVILWLRPLAKADVGTFGGLSIPAPTAILKDGEIQAGENPSTYLKAFSVTQIRLQALIKMADALRPWARWHLTSIDRDRSPKPEKDGFAISEEYRKSVSSAVSAQIAASGDGNRMSEKMLESLGMAAAGSTPAGGWAGAGVLPTILSYASREADIINYGGGVRAIFVDAKSGVYSSNDSTMSKLVSWWRDDLLVSDLELKLLETGPRFATQELMGGRAWSGADREGDGAGAFNKMLAWAFTGANYNNNGILASTMRDFRDKNPISATIEFGERCLKVTGYAIGVSAVAGLASMFPGIGGQIGELINNNLFLASIGGLGLVGLLCVFIAPLTPLIIWMKAILTWFIHVMLALLGAPLLCIATLFPEGKGLAGQHARKGYVQLFDIAIRPPILVACLCIAYALLQAYVMMLSLVFAKFATASSSYATTGVFWQIGMSIMFVAMVYSAIHLLFKTLVAEGPKLVITWIGGIGASIASVENSTKDETNTVGGVMTKGASGMGNAGAGIGGLGKGKGKGKDDDDKGKGGKGGGDIGNMAGK